ncbi:hypothetical protein CBFG_01413 [Clostridiales bacterium 1_7_47FAA]|nr:hypothetical protein CBFG_01413 [Clostridiales bacterium 1_7_47FAA]
MVWIGRWEPIQTIPSLVLVCGHPDLQSSIYIYIPARLCPYTPMDIPYTAPHLNPSQES